MHEHESKDEERAVSIEYSRSVAPRLKSVEGSQSVPRGRGALPDAGAITLSGQPFFESLRIRAGAASPR